MPPPDMPPGMPVTPVSDPKPDTEERYTLLKGRLKEREIGGLLPVQAVPLVERLMDDLCTTQERCQQILQVQLVGLASMPELNGERATLIGFEDEGGGRFLVELSNGQKAVGAV